MAKKDKIVYWNPKNILSKNCSYNIIYGERSNGKTYGVLNYALEEYFKDGGELAIIRRMEEDFRGKRGQQMFDGLVANGVIKRLSHGKYNGVKYYSQRWYFKYDAEKKEDSYVDDKPFAYAFALSTMEHDKSTSYPKIKRVAFDEFLTRDRYLYNEFVLFQNVLSTIIRLRDDVVIFMMGNTVNQWSPYYSEMGLTNIRKQKKGTIDVYTYGESNLRVAVEYTDSPTKDKKSDKYFAFDNPRLQMITNGSWEMDIYPHLPVKYAPKNIMYMYFIKFDNQILQCEIIHVPKDEENERDMLFTFIHRKTTDIKDDGTCIIYQEDSNPLPNYRKRITKPITQIEKRIVSFFAKDKVFYQDNEVGELVRNYLAWCSNK